MPPFITISLSFVFIYVLLFFWDYQRSTVRVFLLVNFILSNKWKEGIYYKLEILCKFKSGPIIGLLSLYSRFGSLSGTPTLDLEVLMSVKYVFVCVRVHVCVCMCMCVVCSVVIYGCLLYFPLFFTMQLWSDLVCVLLHTRNMQTCYVFLCYAPMSGLYYAPYYA